MTESVPSRSPSKPPVDLARAELESDRRGLADHLGAAATAFGMDRATARRLIPIEVCYRVFRKLEAAWSPRADG